LILSTLLLHFKLVIVALNSKLPMTFSLQWPSTSENWKGSSYWKK